jgi:hypothetical protein
VRAQSASTGADNRCGGLGAIFQAHSIFCEGSAGRVVVRMVPFFVKFSDLFVKFSFSLQTKRTGFSKECADLAYLFRFLKSRYTICFNRQTASGLKENRLICKG